MTPSDKKAIAFLLLVIVGALAAFFYFGRDGDLSDPIPTDAQAPSDTLSGATVRRTRTYQYYEKPVAVELSTFDPNTADSTQLLKLGLQSFLVKNIYRYRAHGGVFRQPSDFARLYGLTKKQYEELAPYIRISDDYRPAAELVKDTVYAVRDTLLYPAKLAPGEQIELNHADTLVLRKVPGVGRYYAGRIVQYRRLLGGYVDVSQLREIEGFPDDALSFFTVDTAAVKRLKVNQLSYDQLRRHPYVNHYQARAIVDYRRLYGPLQSLDILALLQSFSEVDRQRLEPYVEF